MSRTVAIVLWFISAALFLFLVILDGSILEGWVRGITQISEVVTLIGVGSLLKKKIIKSDLAHCAAALLVTFVTVIQAIVALPLHSVEVHIISATPSAQDWENLEVRLPDQQAMLSYDSSKSDANRWVFASGGRVLKWGEKAAAESHLRGSQQVDTIPISWPLESLFELFSPRVIEWLGLPGEKSLIRISTVPPDTRLRIVYSSYLGDSILDTASAGNTAFHVRAGGRLHIQAEADSYLGRTFDFDVDSAMTLEITLKPLQAAVTIMAYDLAGNEERSATINIDSEPTDTPTFEKFYLGSNKSYTIVVQLTLDDGRITASEPFSLELFPAADTSIACTLLPQF